MLIFRLEVMKTRWEKRHRTKLSWRQFAIRTGTRPNDVFKAKAGCPVNVTSKVIAAWLNFLECSPNQLIELPPKNVERS
jgi:hypothetical protein